VSLQMEPSNLHLLLLSSITAACGLPLGLILRSSAEIKSGAYERSMFALGSATGFIASQAVKIVQVTYSSSSPACCCSSCWAKNPAVALMSGCGSQPIWRGSAWENGSAGSGGNAPRTSCNHPRWFSLPENRPPPAAAPGRHRQFTEHTKDSTSVAVRSIPSMAADCFFLVIPVSWPVEKPFMSPKGAIDDLKMLSSNACQI